MGKKFPEDLKTPFDDALFVNLLSVSLALIIGNEASHLVNGYILYLANALAGDAKLLADFFESQRVIPV